MRYPGGQSARHVAYSAKKLSGVPSSSVRQVRQVVWEPSQVSQGNSQPISNERLLFASIGYPSGDSVLMLKIVERESPSMVLSGLITSWSKKAISVLAGMSFTVKADMILITFVVVVVNPVTES